MDNGLCDGCRHQRIVRNARGSTFSLCERSLTDLAYARYPRVPVLDCRGFDGRDADVQRPLRQSRHAR
jgi:hypothetical protein